MKSGVAQRAQQGLAQAGGGHAEDRPWLYSITRVASAKMGSPPSAPRPGPAPSPAAPTN